MFPFWVDVAAGLWEQMAMMVILGSACLAQLWASVRTA